MVGLVSSAVMCSFTNDLQLVNRDFRTHVWAADVVDKSIRISTLVAEECKNTKKTAIVYTHESFECMPRIIRVWRVKPNIILL